MKLNTINVEAGNICFLHDDAWFQDQKIAATVLKKNMLLLKLLVEEKTKLTPFQLNKLVEENIIKDGCEPTFLNYKGFPHSVCISLNKELVHGMGRDEPLQEGDVITFDFGVSYKNSSVDSATTMIYGTPRDKNHIKLIETTKKCLDNAIDTIKIGKRIGSIGNAIYKTARDNGFSVINTFGGHAIGFGKDKIHSYPFIANKDNIDSGLRFTSGMCLAIEPLLVPMNSSTETKKSSDGWTIYTQEIGCHFEHTLSIIDDEVEVMT